MKLTSQAAARTVIIAVCQCPSITAVAGCVWWVPSLKSENWRRDPGPTPLPRKAAYNTWAYRAQLERQAAELGKQVEHESIHQKQTRREDWHTRNLKGQFNQVILKKMCRKKTTRTLQNQLLEQVFLSFLCYSIILYICFGILSSNMLIILVMFLFGCTVKSYIFLLYFVNSELFSSILYRWAIRVFLQSLYHKPTILSLCMS